MYRRLSYLFSGSGCRAATTPPRTAAERPARTARFAGSLCAAGRGATRRSATSSTTLTVLYRSKDGQTSRVFTNRSQLVGLRRRFVVQIRGGEGARLSDRFMVPMHAPKRMGAV